MLQKLQMVPFRFFGAMRLTGDFEKNREKQFEKKIGFFPHSGTLEENT